MPACRPAFRPRARASAGFKNARWASAPELGTTAQYHLYRAMSFISFISSELRLAIIYIIRVRACIASVSDCVRPHVPLYDRVYSPETAYIYQQIVPTLPDTPSASHGTTSRVLVHGSLRMSTCIAHVAPQPSVPPSDRRMPPSDPTPTRPIAAERRQACQTSAMAAPRTVHPPTEPICPNALD